MKVENKNKLAFFTELYENAKASYAETDERLRTAMAQYRGDCRIDGSNEPASMVRNITYELIEGEVSSAIPAPRVLPAVYSEKNDRNAKAVEELCAMLRDRLPFEELNDLDERYTYIYGGSVFYVEWDENGGGNASDGALRVHCLSPLSFLPEPYVADVANMEYCFLRFDTTRDELARRYRVSAEKTALFAADDESAATDENFVTEVVCFYRNEDGRVSRYVFSGDCELSDEPAMYARLSDGKVMESETLSSPRLLSDGGMIPAYSPAVDENGNLVRENGEVVMEKTAIPYYMPEEFPIVIRRNVSKDGELYGESDCAVIRPQQQAINKVESRIMQKLMRAGVTPVLPEDATVTLTNAIFGQALRTKPGENASSYGVLDTTPAITQDVAEAERLYLQAKRILGISDTYIGQTDDTAISGRAKEIQIAQASGRLESKRRMKNSAYARIDRLIFLFYLAFADKSRAIPVRDAIGDRHNVFFSRYDFLEYDETNGSYYYNDDYLFSADPSGGVEQQREALWQRNLDNLRAGTLGEPTLPQTLYRYWQFQDRAHYPNARENAEYFRALIGESEAPLGL